MFHQLLMHRNSERTVNHNNGNIDRAAVRIMTTKSDLTSKVFDELRDEIRDFKLLPGVRVSDKEIAERLTISRTPVREALVRLTAVGLLESLPNRGFRVRAFTGKDISELYTLRESLEVLAVQLATSNLNPERIAQLQQTIDGYDRAIKSGRLKEACNCDGAFHDLIAKYSENTLLYKTLHAMGDMIHIARSYDHLKIGSPAIKTTEEHQLILKLMMDGQGAAAAQVMTKHITESKEFLEKIQD